MLIDNTIDKKTGQKKTLYHYFEKKVKDGQFDIVTGYFSINMLAIFGMKFNEVKAFRMILGNLVYNDKLLRQKTFELLNENWSVDKVLALPKMAQAAVAFLQQDKVQLKTVDSRFCHAKSYMYTAKDYKDSFYAIGSANLTETGLGKVPSSNIELNTLIEKQGNDYADLEDWFTQIWEQTAQASIQIQEQKQDFKQHLIQTIQDLYVQYTPKDLYYKILYELFKKDLDNLSEKVTESDNFTHLKDTKLYHLLYPFQKKGVLTLIKMMQQYNGAILADAVGLGKTWQALAVMKFFELEGYRVIVLCPKKLRQNWDRYRGENDSLFKNDDLNFLVRNHTDLQDERLSKYEDHKIGYLQGRSKVLFVIDESHNFRNDKSNRYQFLVDELLRKSRDVKVLLLSATPINNSLKDVRNQFKLLVKGYNNGFANTTLEINNLEDLFKNGTTKFKTWQKEEKKHVADLISQLPKQLFDMTDALIVARTRKLITEHGISQLNFPTKLVPHNIYESPQVLGNFKSFEDLLNKLFELKLTAYQPATYIKQQQDVPTLKNEKYRQHSLVKMMLILLLKRLESSWFSFRKTINKTLDYHQEALRKVYNFMEKKENATLSFSDENMLTVLENIAIEYERNDEFMLGKHNPISLSQIGDIESFKVNLLKDIQCLQSIVENLTLFAQQLKTEQVKDTKLEELAKLIQEKQEESANKKVLIFTVYKDTAFYLFEALQAKGFDKIACVSGSLTKDDSQYSSKHFEPILERFAPYTKLFKEKDWTSFYEEHQINPKEITFQKWQQLIQQFDPKTTAQLQNPIDILISTDCLSEGQNLQDCDYVVNYDIHWNPVRLIQRFGRIDRLGSPNQQIQGVNFWPAQNFEALLNLKSRIEERLTLMTLAGSEIQKATPQIKEMTANNPLVPKQVEKMLHQLQTTWEDIEVSDSQLGMNDLSLENFRQELFDLLLKDKEKYEGMKQGIFSGFQTTETLLDKKMPTGMVALLGYPKKNPRHPKPYEEYSLLYTSKKERRVLKNQQQILAFLRQHKNKARFVSPDLEKGKEQTLKQYKALLEHWAMANISQKTTTSVLNLLQGDMFAKTVPPKTKPKRKTSYLEQQYKLSELDLVCWLAVEGI